MKRVPTFGTSSMRQILKKTKKERMKKLLFLSVILLCGDMLSAQECGGMPTGMNVLPISTSGFRIQFYRPLRPAKYWIQKDVPYYENGFKITLKPYFTQGDNRKWEQSMDTTTIVLPFQMTANEHSSIYEYTSLLPGTSYKVCIYTYCGNNIYEGPLCDNATTSTEAPCTLSFDAISETAGKFKFNYKPNTHVLADHILFQYREGNSDWHDMAVNDSNGAYLDTMKKGMTYYARVKFFYTNLVESQYSDEISVHF